MTLSLKPLTTTIIGGLVFLLPLIVLLAVLGQGVALMAGLAQPVAALFPYRQVGGVALVSLIALLLLLLLSLLLSLFLYSSLLLLSLLSRCFLLSLLVGGSFLGLGL